MRECRQLPVGQEKAGWVQAALDSALRNLIALWPTAFQQQFGEAEKKAFAKDRLEKERKLKSI